VSDRASEGVFDTYFTRVSPLKIDFFHLNIKYVRFSKRFRDRDVGDVLDGS